MPTIAPISSTRLLGSLSKVTANSTPFRDSLRGLPPLRPGGIQAGLGALADDTAFKLGEGREHVKNQLATWGRGIHAFLQAFEADTPLLQGGHNLQEVFERSPQPVRLPHGQHVPFAGKV
jgi:hypothetical protein